MDSGLLPSPFYYHPPSLRPWYQKPHSGFRSSPQLPQLPSDPECQQLVFLGSTGEMKRVPHKNIQKQCKLFCLWRCLLSSFVICKRASQFPVSLCSNSLAAFCFTINILVYHCVKTKTPKENIPDICRDCALRFLAGSDPAMGRELEGSLKIEPKSIEEAPKFIMLTFLKRMASQSFGAHSRGSCIGPSPSSNFCLPMRSFCARVSDFSCFKEESWPQPRPTGDPLLQ